jgi:hypothetical protein
MSRLSYLGFHQTRRIPTLPRLGTTLFFSYSQYVSSSIFSAW